MLINSKVQTLFVSTPKCATNAIYEHLMRDAQWVRYSGFHATKIPVHCADYRKITIVRNPYARAISTVFFAVENPHTQRNLAAWLPDGVTPNIIEFYNHQEHWPDATQTMTERHAGTDFDEVIRFENLHERFPGIDSVNATTHKPYQYYLTGDVLEFLNERYADDFRNYDYQMEGAAA